MRQFNVNNKGEITSCWWWYLNLLNAWSKRRRSRKRKQMKKISRAASTYFNLVLHTRSCNGSIQFCSDVQTLSRKTIQCSSVCYYTGINLHLYFFFSFSHCFIIGFLRFRSLELCFYFSFQLSDFLFGSLSFFPSSSLCLQVSFGMLQIKFKRECIPKKRWIETVIQFIHITYATLRFIDLYASCFLSEVLCFRVL